MFDEKFDPRRGTASFPTRVGEVDHEEIYLTGSIKTDTMVEVVTEFKGSKILVREGART